MGDRFYNTTQYLINPIKANKAHLWDGKDTYCRMWSTGGLVQKHFKVFDSTGGRDICYICLQREKEQDLRVFTPDVSYDPIEASENMNKLSKKDQIYLEALKVVLPVVAEKLYKYSENIDLRILLNRYTKEVADVAKSIAKQCAEE